MWREGYCIKGVARQSPFCDDGGASTCKQKGDPLGCLPAYHHHHSLSWEMWWKLSPFPCSHFYWHLKIDMMWMSHWQCGIIGLFYRNCAAMKLTKIEIPASPKTPLELYRRNLALSWLLWFAFFVKDCICNFSSNVWHIFGNDGNREPWLDLGWRY